MATVSDRHRKKEEDQNCQNIAKDRYPQAILSVGAISSSSERMNDSFPECFVVRSSASGVQILTFHCQNSLVFRDVILYTSLYICMCTCRYLL